MAKRVTHRANAAAPQGPSWWQGYVQGVLDVMDAEGNTHLFVEEFIKGLPAGRERMQVRLAALDHAKLGRETAAQKSARLRRAKRIVNDVATASTFAALVKAGKTTEEVHAALRIGVVRAQRIRAVAVRMGLLQAYQRARLAEEAAHLQREKALLEKIQKQLVEKLQKPLQPKR